MTVDDSDLRAERARFIDEINRRRITLGKSQLRRQVLPIHVVAEGVTKLSWFADVVVEMPRRSSWYFGEIADLPMAWLDSRQEAAERMLKRLGGEWVLDAHFNTNVEGDAPHFGLRDAACVPWWVPRLRKALPPSQRAAAIRLVLSAPESFAQVETTLRLASSPGSVRSLVNSLLAHAE